ncbi:hypothetical protein [Haladaptatus pallidirubidus]|uniref:Uncharacterized protein n=2 Tax=Haladaptatus pallidirubidus TaxID=1008152 RepID=A0AAV3UK80_9EURY|nr:hypothetical protein [Haladaptatus pallidirubidus]
MNVGVFLLIELFVFVTLLSVGGVLIRRCRASGEWQPRGLRDAERDVGIEEEWR